MDSVITTVKELKDYLETLDDDTPVLGDRPAAMGHAFTVRLRIANAYQHNDDTSYITDDNDSFWADKLDENFTNKGKVLLVWS